MPTRSRSRSRRPIVTFSNDDNYLSLYTGMFPLFRDRGIAGNIVAPISHIVDTQIGGNARCSAAQIDEMVYAGWEITCHGYTHADPTMLEPNSAELALNISGAKAMLEAYGWTVPCYAPPGGQAWRRDVRDLALQNFRGIRLAAGTLYTNNQLLRPDAIAARCCDDSAAFATYVSYVDEAIAQRDWLVFYNHDMDAADLAMLEALVDYVLDNGLPIMPMAQALDELEPEVAIGDTDEGGATIDESGARIVGDLHIRQAQHVRVAQFLGTGLDDLQSACHSYVNGSRTYVVEIDSCGTPDTFRWSDDTGATWKAASVAITGSHQISVNGFRVVFRTTTGHTVGDRWIIEANNTGGTISLRNAYNQEKFAVSNAGAVTGASFVAGASAGATGSFTTVDGKTVTVTGGIITAIV